MYTHLNLKSGDSRHVYKGIKAEQIDLSAHQIGNARLGHDENPAVRCTSYQKCWDAAAQSSPGRYTHGFHRNRQSGQFLAYWKPKRYGPAMAPVRHQKVFRFDMNRCKLLILLVPDRIRTCDPLLRRQMICDFSTSILNQINTISPIDTYRYAAYPFRGCLRLCFNIYSCSTYIALTRNPKMADFQQFFRKTGSLKWLV